jgi:hypothetical protein
MLALEKDVAFLRNRCDTLDRQLDDSKRQHRTARLTQEKSQTALAAAAVCCCGGVRALASQSDHLHHHAARWMYLAPPSQALIDASY